MAMSVEEDKSSEEGIVKEVNTAEALQTIEMVKMWKLFKISKHLVVL